MKLLRPDATSDTNKDKAQMRTAACLLFEFTLGAFSQNKTNASERHD